MAGIIYMRKVYICKPYPKHIFQKFPLDIVHQIHKLTFGIILIDHIEPDGRLASAHHKDYVLFTLMKEIYERR